MSSDPARAPMVPLLSRFSPVWGEFAGIALKGTISPLFVGGGHSSVCPKKRSRDKKMYLWVFPAPLYSLLKFEPRFWELGRKDRVLFFQHRGETNPHSPTLILGVKGDS